VNELRRTGGTPTRKVAVVTDSIACLTREQVEKYEIQIIPINFFAGGKVYHDWVDITPSEAYELFLADPDSFKTSAATPEDCLNAFRNASQLAPNILCVTVSSDLSTVYNVAIDSREMLKTELPEVSIEVLDSRSATPSEGFIVLAAARAAAEGKDIAETLQIAKSVKDRVGAVLFLDTIRHVYRSGRIPRIASQIGTMLNIKPILSVAGKVHFHGAVRNREQGMTRILQMMKEKAGGRLLHVAVVHAYAPEEAEELKKRIESEFNCIELWLAEFSPVMGYACGTGTVGAAFYPEL
jgi:DegV family protein with EDD domain